jgi:hypothetical protein
MNTPKQLLIFIIFSLFSTAVTQAQLATYTTMQNEVMVWDNGFIRKIDYLRPLRVQVGRYAMAYLDNSNNFKIYANGGTVEINRGFTNNFQATDYLITYQNASSLYVWEKGKPALLTKSYGEFYTGDSIVVYFDDLRKNYNIYYNGRVTELEGFLAGTNINTIFKTEEGVMVTSQDIAQGQLSQISVSDNIVAYVNFANQFKCFFKGMIWDLEDFGVESFAVGRNTVAYVDNNSHFKIYHSGGNNIYDNFRPESYAVGDDLVAFVGSDYRFKIYYNDSIYDIGNIDAQYRVKDNIVAYKNARGYFSVFYKGKIYEIENFVPQNYTIHYNSLVYANRGNMLRMFSYGKTYDVVNADVPWELFYDVLTYRFGSNMFKVFYQGETY